MCSVDLPNRPSQVVVPTTLECAELDALAAGLPTGDVVVGIGGGMVVDAAFHEIAGVMTTCRAVAPKVGAGSREGAEFVMRSFERLTRLRA